MEGQKILALSISIYVRMGKWQRILNTNARCLWLLPHQQIIDSSRSNSSNAVAAFNSNKLIAPKNAKALSSLARNIKADQTEPLQ
jgi:hypothetical protein